jgi:hypothetical protein
MWKTILEVILKIVGFTLDKLKISNQNKKKFIRFIANMRIKIDTTKLRKSVLAQVKRLKDARKSRVSKKSKN